MNPPDNTASPQVDAQHPWLGLLPYKEEHREFFFGRDREVEDILGRIRDNSLTILYGQSGLGKSSLLAAGVVPRLREAGYEPRIFRLRFEEPRWPLFNQVEDAFLGAVHGTECGGLCEGWLSFWEMVHQKTYEPKVGIPVLIFDQFEEIFTLGSQPQFQQEVAEWWDQMSDLLQNRPPKHLTERFADDPALAAQYHFGPAPIRIVFTLREDYLAQLEAHKARLPLLMQNRMALSLLTGPQARQAVLGPAQLGEHALVTREVAESIVRRVADVPADTPLDQIKAVPPLLSLLCEQLNAARLEKVASASAEPHSSEDLRLKPKPPSEPPSQITAESVREQSTDILQRFYEDSFLSFPAGHRARIRALIEDPPMITEAGYRNALVRQDAEAQLTRAGVPEPKTIFDTLIQRRLITCETLDQVQRLEITHDVLVPLLLRSRTERQDREAKEQAERKLAEERSQARKRWALAAAMLVLTGSAALVGAWFGLSKADKLSIALKAAAAERARAVESEFLASSARKVAETALSEAKTSLERSQLEEGRAWLERAKGAMNKHEHLSALMLAGRAVGYQGYGRLPQESESFTKAFPLLLSKPMTDPAAEQERQAEMADLTQFIADTQPTQLPLWCSAKGGSVFCVAFSPDGTRLASGSGELLSNGKGELKLWDVASGKELATLSGHTAYVLSVAFSPDGSRLASGSADKTIKLWDVASGKEVATLSGHTDAVWTVAFSPDGSRLASGSADKTIKLWDVASGKEVVTDAAGLAGAEQWLAAQERRLSPDGKTMAVEDDKTIYLVPSNNDAPDLAIRLREGLLALPGRELEFPKINGPTKMLHVRNDVCAQLDNPDLTPEKRAELQMLLCTKSGQFRAATAQWQRLQRGEWPMSLGATEDGSGKGNDLKTRSTSVPADSELRRLYLLALIDATKHPQIHGHPTICQTAAQIAPVLTKEMMATPTTSLAMMSLMQTLAKDDSSDMSASRATLMKKLEEVATKEWLAVLR